MVLAAVASGISSPSTGGDASVHVSVSCDFVYEHQTSKSPHWKLKEL